MTTSWRDPRRVVLAALAVAIAVGCTWGLPCTSSWAADAISPRSCGLGAIVESFRTGHFHIYPPLHMAILTVVSAPWILLAGSRVGFAEGALGAELIKPLYMTGVEVGARLVAAAMALGVVWNTMRLWTRLRGSRIGVAAGAIVAANAVFVFYAHTGNMEVPYVFWLTCALVEIDRVASGEAREGPLLLFAVAAALTKDQAAGALFLPLAIYVLLVPWLVRRAPPMRRSLVRAALVAIVVYALGSGALTNPSGYSRRIAVLFGTASQDWFGYPRGLSGTLGLVQDSLSRLPSFTSWAIGIAAVAGVIVALLRRGPEWWRTMLPLVAAVSFSLSFNLNARRADLRFLLPQSVFFFPYAAVAFDAWWSSRKPRRTLVVAVAALAVVPALVRVASLDATLLADSRYEVERLLAELPAGTRVEVYGSPIFLPRLPPTLAVVRAGPIPIAERHPIPGVAELVDVAMDPRPRAPELIVMATDLTGPEADEPPTPPSRYRIVRSLDPVTRGFVRALRDGSLGYRAVMHATCSVPWPLECMKIHGSTGEDAFVYASAPRVR